MPEVFQWHTSADRGTAVLRAVQELARGGLVAFPTETAYGLAACALAPDAVACLGAVARPGLPPLTLAVRDGADALDWVPAMSPTARRLARRCWPGPVELVWTHEGRDGLSSRLPGPVREALCPAGALRLRTPAHEAILQALYLLPGPLVLAPVNGADVTEAEQVLRAAGDRLGVLIDDGPSRYGRPASVVRVTGDDWELLVEGVVPRDVLARLTGRMILFVCTGNTCRSPLAEALCKKLLADRLGCMPDDLPRRGFFVQSAGLAAMMGDRAAEEAVTTARQYGAELEGHSSQPVTPELVSQADQIIVMTHGHLRALLGQYPRLPVRPRLLAAGGEDVPDPIGCGRDVYEVCAKSILGHLEPIVSEVLQS